jgi:glycosyltransferase involved in cell wall biosynthesis
MDKRRMQPAPDAPPDADRRPVIAIYRAPLFNPSETFVRAHALALMRYRPLLAGIGDKGNVPPELQGSLVVPGSAVERGLVRLGMWRSMAERLRRERPCLVHAHFGPDALAAAPLSRALGVPLIATLHGYDVTRARARMLLSGRLSWVRYALRRDSLVRAGALFLPVSDALRRMALEQGFPAERMRTHYLGVDLDRFTGGGAREPGLVLHVGRLVEKKGTAVLIDAVARLREARLVVIGDGPERGRLEGQAAGLGERVRFLGALAPPEVASWMRSAAVLAAPSVTARDGDAEGLPTVIIEAAASALPTVGTLHSGIPEAVVDGETGFLVPERDVEALAARLDTLLGSNDLRQRMGGAARRLAGEKFDLRIQTARLEAIYDEVRGQIRP